DAVSEAGTTPTLDGERALWRGVFDPPGCTDLVLLARRVVAVAERRVVALPDHTPTVFGWGTRAHRLIVSGTAARIGTTRRSGAASCRAELAFDVHSVNERPVANRKRHVGTIECCGASASCAAPNPIVPITRPRRLARPSVAAVSAPTRAPAPKAAVIAPSTL